MQILTINMFILFCFPRTEPTGNKENELESEDENTVNPTAPQNDTLLEALEKSFLNMKDHENETNTMKNEIFKGSHDTTITELIGLFHSQFKILEMTYFILKELTAEKPFTVSSAAATVCDVPSGICLCLDTRFCSKLRIAKEGFEKVENLLIKMKEDDKYKSGAFHIDMKSYADWFQVFQKYFSQYKGSLEIYRNYLYYHEEKEMPVNDSEYRVFLQQKFCCLMNTFILMLDDLNRRTQCEDTDKEVFDINQHIRQLIYTDLSVDTPSIEQCDANQHIKNTIQMFFLFEREFKKSKYRFICLGSFFNLRNTSTNLLSMIFCEPNGASCSLNPTVIDEFRTFIDSSGVCSLDVFYDEFLVEIIDMLIELKEELDDQDRDVEDIKKFYTQEIETLKKTYESLEIFELLRWTCTVIYFVQEWVLNAQKTNFNIFLGFASLELNRRFVFMYEYKPIAKLEKVFNEWLQNDKLELNEKLEAKLLIEIKYLSYYFNKIKKIIDLLNRGWLKVNYLDIDGVSEKQKRLEKKLKEYMTKYKFRHYDY